MKMKKILVGLLIPVMVLAMMPVVGQADGGKTVKLGETVTVSGYDEDELQAALAEYTIEGVDSDDVVWTPADDWSEAPMGCEKVEHDHGLNMTEEDVQNCPAIFSIDGFCPYMGDEQIPTTDPRVANNHNESNRIPASNGPLYYHEEHNAVCFLSGNTYDGQFFRWGGICKSPHAHVEYAAGMTNGEWCKKPGTWEFTAASSDDSDYTIGEADVTVTGGGEFSYDGQPHGITVTVNDRFEGATVTFGDSEGNYTSPTSPTRTDVGKTTIYFEVTADGWTSYTGTATVTVNAKPVTLTWGNTAFTYDGTPHAPTATVSTGDFVADDEVKVVVKGEQIIASQTPYKATALLSGDDAGNYALKNPEIEFTIGKKDPAIGQVTVSQENGEIKEDTNPATIKLDREDSQVPGTLVLTDTELSVDVKVYNWKFTPTDDTNYLTVTGTVEIEVAEAETTDPGDGDGTGDGNGDGTDDGTGDGNGDGTGTDDGNDELKPNGDGTYSDEDGNIYIPTDDDGDGEVDGFVNVKPNEDGSYKDEDGNIYIPVDKDGDGKVDEFVKVTPNEDGSCKDGDGNIYIAVDKDGDGKADEFVKVKKNKDGTYSDDANGDGIFGGKGDNSYVSNGAGAFVVQSDSETPETGDTTQIALWIGLLLAAATGFGVARRVREK